MSHEDVGKRLLSKYFILLVLAFVIIPNLLRAETWNITQVAGGQLTSSRDMTITNHPVTGNPTIAYYGQSGSVYNINYAVYNNGSWTITKIKDVAINGKGDLGIDFSYHPQTANPSFAYFDGYKNLYVSTTVNGSFWTDEIVDTDCLFTVARYRIDQNGTPWVAYNKVENISGRYFVKIASKQGASWSISTLEEDAFVYSSAINPATGYPAIVYFKILNYSPPQASFKYAYYNGTTWVKSDTDGIIYTSGSDRVSLSFIPGINYPAIFHSASNSSTSGAKYVHWNGSSWITETVDSGNIESQFGKSLSFNPISGYPAIVYKILTTGAPSYLRTHMYSYFDGNNWIKEVLASELSVRYDVLTFSNDGIPRIAYYLGGAELYYATKSPAVECTYTLSPTSYGFSSLSNTGNITVTSSSGTCTWTATSNDSWITITSGSSGTGSGAVSYTVAANTTGSTRTGTMTVAGSTITITQTGFNAALYFPHIDTSLPWQTEIAIINTSNQTVTGTLRGLSNDGQLTETRDVTLSARGRRQITIANEFTNHTNIGYIIFDTSSDAVHGYTKFYQSGKYRAAIPAVKEVNTSDIYVSHIDAGAQWWTGVSLVNTTAATKTLTMTFNNGQSRVITLNANQHQAFLIDPQPDIRSAVITNASGVIGLELFGNIGGSDHLEGILLTDKTATTLYYPHVAGDGWWTGVVAYNPSASACTITITPYSAQGTALTPSTRTIAGREKYIGLVSDLNLPAQTAWFRIGSTSPLSGFELFSTLDGNQLAAYAGGGGTGAKTGVFAKIEKNGGWTGIAFVNTEESVASVTLTAYNDNGTAVATQVLPVGGHAKVVHYAETIFSQNISSATYIAYSSDRNVVGFQLNGTSDGMMLDGLPALTQTANIQSYFPLITGATWVYARNGSQTSTTTITCNGLNTFQGQFYTEFLAVTPPHLTKNYMAFTSAGLVSAGAIDWDIPPITFTTVWSPAMIWIPTGAAPGYTWTQTGTETVSGQVGTSEGSVTVESVTVPAGTYDNCLKCTVTTSTAGSSSTTTTWYAPNVGMVKRVFHGIGTEEPDGVMELISFTN